VVKKNIYSEQSRETGLLRIVCFVSRRLLFALVPGNYYSWKKREKQSPQGKKAMTGLGKFLALKSKKEVEKSSLEIANAIWRSYGKCFILVGKNNIVDSDSNGFETFRIISIITQTVLQCLN
jgi:hypothetical protein